MQAPATPSDRLDTHQAATYLGIITASTLVSWRSRGCSPIPFHRVAHRVFYQRADLDAFLATGRVVQQPTASGDVKEAAIKINCDHDVDINHIAHKGSF